VIRIRRADERGRTRLAWLDSRHTFSFGGYHDPDHMGFRALRVLNDDRVAPGGGFGTHPHRDMEILSFVLSGALAHEDSTGAGSVIHPGEVQRMTAGSGVRHSEMNPSAEEPVRFLQVWILPERMGLEPGYEQRAFAHDELADRLRLVASPDGRDGSITVHQDALVYLARLGEDGEAAHPIGPGRHAWVQVASGEVYVNDEVLAEGDGVAVSAEEEIRLSGREAGEVLLFDLA
jgi:redox-sensitive bicupin YhaK (pirin superfamily)